ncbi:hypothetical protein D9613_008475 [Agrocybe pediades]|uniref:Uncharacterized protein n=1 Tax=Agrocybe pediades TaxID=84607 RepID=A0A8H4QT08_9AGAR|nr:hypothetical protein D9613_008475 [Agrocybe pediades]
MATLTPQQAGMAIVRKLIEKHSFPNGFTTQEMYKLASQEPSPAPFIPHKVLHPGLPTKPETPIFTRKAILKRGKLASDVIHNYPENPDHPIRSIRFLKKEVLQHLEDLKVIKMARIPTPKGLAAQEAAGDKKTRLTASQVDWKWKVVPDSERLAVPPSPPKGKEVVGTEVGVGHDVSHLNKRRQEARTGKVSEAVSKLKSYKEYAVERDAFLDRMKKNPQMAITLRQKYENQLRQEPRPYELDNLLEHERRLRRVKQSVKMMSKQTAEMKQEFEKSLEMLRRYASYRNQNKMSAPIA